MQPAALVDNLQFPVQELPVAVGAHRQLDSHGFQCRQILISARLKRFHLAEVLPVGLVVGFMGDQLGSLVLTKDGVENIRSGDPALSQNPRVQSAIDANVTHQPGIVFGAALVFRQQLLHEAQLFQLR